MKLEHFGLTKKEEINSFSLTPSMQPDTFHLVDLKIEMNKNLVFFHSTKKMRIPTLKARVIQAIQTKTQPKLALHLLSANSHKKNKIINLKIKMCIFTKL